MIGSAAGGILGAVGGLTNLFGQGGMNEYEEAARIIEAVKDPNFDISQLTPAQLAIVAQLEPALYQARVPEEMRNIVERPEVMQAQMGALKGWEKIAQEGLPEEDRLLANEAQRAMATEHRRGVEATLRNLAERGRLSGGAEIAARLGASQQVADLGRDLGSDLQRAAIQNRLAALAQSGQLSGEIRGQDIESTARSADIANRFNQYIADTLNQASRFNAEQQMRSNQWNAANVQDTANRNAMMAYQNRARNQEYANQMKGQLSNFQLQKAGMVSGAKQKLGWAKDAEKAGKINALAGLGYGLGSVGDFGLISGLGGFGGGEAATGAASPYGYNAYGYRIY